MSDLGERIHLSHRGAMPIYSQLAGQLRYLIITGEIPAGTRLPSARHLSANLGVNRNTVHRAYAILGDAGLVSASRGRGTTVAGAAAPGRVTSGTSSDVIRGLIDQLRLESARLGISQPEDIAAVVLSHLRFSGAHADVKVALIECNPDSLRTFDESISSEFGVEVNGVLLRDLGALLDEDRSLGGCRCAITTFFHFTEVRSLLRATASDLELIAIGVRPHVTVLRELELLADGSVLGIAYFDDGTSFAEERLGRMTEAVDHAHVPGVAVQPMLVDGRTTPEAFAGLSAVLIRPENFRPALGLLPEGLRTIEFANDLDSASQQFLAEILSDLRRTNQASAARR